MELMARLMRTSTFFCRPPAASGSCHPAVHAGLGRDVESEYRWIACRRGEVRELALRLLERPRGAVVVLSSVWIAGLLHYGIDDVGKYKRMEDGFQPAPK